MTIPSSAADVLSGHVSLEVECVDRMYLNLYVPKLQYEFGVLGSLRDSSSFGGEPAGLAASGAAVSAVPGVLAVIGR